jgi:uncharacterized protein (TIGR03066 family)
MQVSSTLCLGLVIASSIGWDDEAIKIDPAELVGIWEVVKATDIQPGSTLEFTRAGKFELIPNAKNRSMYTGTFKIKGNQVTVDPAGMSITVKELTQTKLVIDGLGDIAEYKRKDATATARVAGGPRWQVVAIHEGKATVEMPPGPVERLGGGMEGPQGIYAFYLKIVEVAGVQYEAYAFEGPKVISDEAAPRELKRARDFVISTYSQGKVTSDKPIQSAAGAGREFTASVAMRSMNGLPARGRAYIADRWIYVVIANPIVSGEELPAEAGRFLDSFAVIGRVGEAAEKTGLTDIEVKSGKADAKPLKAWGTEVDPDDDVEIEATGETLTIRIPGTPHVLSSEETDGFNAPRVVSPVRREFAATVRVDGEFRPSRESSTGMLSSRQAGGLLLWKDSDNYIVLQRRTVVGKEGKLNRQVIFDERKGGKRGVTLDQPSPDGPVFLRLKRKDGIVTAAFSSDGRRWTSFKPIDAQWSRGVADVGVVAVNTSTGPHAVTFDEYSLEAK